MSNSKAGFLKQTLGQESGMALMLVLGVITILIFLLADFTFEVKLNKIKIYNQQDKIQARLNAESGLNFAISKLRIYQEGRNKLEKEESLKSAFPTSDLESIIIEPFIYPIPTPKKANIVQRTALEEFTKKTLFRGEVSVTFAKVSGFLNPNGLRLQPKVNASKQDEDSAAEKEFPGGNGAGLGEDDDDDAAASEDGKKKAQKADVIIEKKLTETLQRLIKDKSDVDEEFHSKYANLEATSLVKELKFYVNDSAQFQDSMRPEIEAKFSQKGITPKHAPLSSIDELYLLPSWDDAIVDLIKDRMSVHEVNVISINELNTEDLKILFPAINNVQIEEFFKYRDGDVDKKIKGNKFKSAEDFKSVVVSTLNIVSDTDYSERINELKQAGLSIDIAGKLYKVNSRGVYNNAVYNIVAFIDLPIKPQPPKKNKKKNPGDSPGAGDDESDPSKDLNDPKNPGSSEDKKDSTDGKKEDEEKVPLELLLPRVIEIRLE